MNERVRDVIILHYHATTGTVSILATCRRFEFFPDEIVGKERRSFKATTSYRDQRMVGELAGQVMTAKQFPRPYHPMPMAFACELKNSWGSRSMSARAAQTSTKISPHER